LRLRPFDDPRRGAVKWLGTTNDGPREWIGVTVDDARRHVDIKGLTGSGKTVFETGFGLREARAGRGLAVIDLQGDMSNMLLDRLPAECAHRLVIIDPADRAAPPAFNPLSALGAGGGEHSREAAEWAADTLTSVFAQLYRAWWGPRMDELMRSACITLAAQPGSTLPDVLRLLTDAGFRRNILDVHPPAPVLATLWTGFEQLSAYQRTNLCAPLASRLRAVLSRSFAAQLLSCPVSTFSLTDILDGGILIARLPKGELGADAARLIGSLLVSGLWAHTTRRSLRPPEQRPDATIIIDEAHNLLNLPIGVDEALAESRGYRVSWVLAHQNLAQLSEGVRNAIDANARTKIYFTVSPDDAKRLAAHVRPHLSEYDLANRPAREMTVRSIHHGHNQVPYTLDSPPLPDPIPGQADRLRAVSRRLCGLTDAQRERYRDNYDGSGTVRNSPLRPPAPPGGARPGGAAGRGQARGQLPNTGAAARPRRSARRPRTEL
jgi:hypothetical protein